MATQPIRGGMSSREIDRRSWAQIERLKYDVIMRGSGEYLMDEPIYFGRAYSAPPTFTYSAAAQVSEEDMLLPHIFTPPRDAAKTDIDAQGVSPSTMGTNNWVQDPGFEVQGQWIGEVTDAEVIPDVHIYNTGASYANIIYDNYVAASFVREPYWSNCWVQTADSNTRWVVSADKPHDLGLGYAGKYSAKYVFGSETSSNWLQPIYTTDWGTHGGGLPAQDEWLWASAKIWPSSKTADTSEGFIYAEPPPYFSGWDGFTHIWSDSDCELETYSYEWDYSDSPFEDEYPDWQKPWRGTNDDLGIRMRNFDNQMFQVTADTWNKIEFYFPYTNDKAYPNFPYKPWSVPGDDTDYNPGEAFWSWRFRINNGSTNQIVYLDNTYIWPRLRNLAMPIITIGIAEWITDFNDEFGEVYVGAKLWFKVGTVA